MYLEARGIDETLANYIMESYEPGLCTLTPPDPHLPVAERRLVPRWFQPFHLSSQKPVSKFVFQIQQLRRYFQDKEQKEYMGWLHNVSNFVSAKKP